MDNVLDAVSQISALFSKLIIGVGIGVIFYYCAFVINFFPTGLSLGDSLIFIFIALAFGLFYLLWILLGYVTVYQLASPFSEKIGKKNSNTERIFTFIIGFILLLFTSIFWIFTDDINSTLAPLLAGSIILIITTYWSNEGYSPINAKQKFDPKTKLYFIIFALFIAGFLGHKVVDKFIGNSFNTFKISQKRVSIKLNDTNNKVAEEISNEFNVPIYNCDINGQQFSI